MLPSGCNPTRPGHHCKFAIWHGQRVLLVALAQQVPAQLPGRNTLHLCSVKLKTTAASCAMRLMSMLPEGVAEMVAGGTIYLHTW